MLLKSRAFLTCFRACFLPGRAKDLSAPRYLLAANFMPHEYYQSGLLAIDRILCVLQILQGTKLVICHCGVMLVIGNVGGNSILHGQHCF